MFSKLTKGVNQQVDGLQTAPSTGGVFATMVLGSFVGLTAALYIHKKIFFRSSILLFLFFFKIF